MKILLVQTSFLGDTILSTPVISGIKTVFPDAELWMMTTPLSAHLVRRDPLLAGVIPFDKRNREAGLRGVFSMARQLRQMRFERVYSLHRSFRTSLLLWLAGIPVRIGCTDAKLSWIYHTTRRRDFAQHDVLRNLSILKGELAIGDFHKEMRLFAPPRAEVHPAAIDAVGDQTRPCTVIAPGSVWKTKMWFSEGYHAVAETLLNRGHTVILTGSPEDAAVCRKVAGDLPVINLAGKTDLSDTLYVVKQADLVLCNDSMILHMASAFKIPTVAVFCATSPRFGYGPWKNRAIVVEKKDLYCKPCRPHGSHACPEGTDACMNELPPAEVLAAIDKVLGE